MTRDRIVIIGAGIAGLASAALLARDGADVVVLEASDVVGGRAGSWESEGFRFDTGPSWYLMPEVFDHFFRLFGSSAAEELDLVELDPGYRVYSDGYDDALDIRADRESNVALFEAQEAGAGAALERYLDSSEEAYSLALERFLYSDFSAPSAFLDASLLPRLPKLTRLLTNSLDAFAGDYVSDRRLRQVLGYPAVFLGTSPYKAPALYHLMSHLDLEQGVLYPRGGFTTIIAAIERIARAQGVRIETGARVTRIRTERTSRRTRATGVDYVQDGVAHRIDATRVVSAADLHHTETELVPADRQTYPESWWQKRDPGPGAVLAMLGVRGEVAGLLHHSLFFTADWRGDFEKLFGDDPTVPEPTSFYACMPSATDDSVAPEGDTNLFLLIPVPADTGIGSGGIDGAGSAEVESIVDRAIARLADVAGDPDLADRIVTRRTVGPADFESDLNSWRGGALGPAHTLRQSAFFRGRNSSKVIEGLHYAGGTTIPGIGLPMCLISAEILAKGIRGDRSTSPLPEPVRSEA
ncbi:phytoene desaturase family protein [Agromyces atrinae]|uniref:phytoene desaturase family protein n=1 Tax=Agromyces atrinae TaxID=592376 RepID=UPI001F567D0A|nr:phytoene desaturase family protein [Agromyces atrinae]MCI2958858.1 phytoene desaturase family protein [Agromyces atrinae]